MKEANIDKMSRGGMGGRYDTRNLMSKQCR